jgi:membrane fusion protein (multidrug efflux system)
VALSRAEAQLQQAQATLRQSEDNFARVQELSRRGVATEKQREDALASRDQARASVQAAEAEIATAKLNLGYTDVRAPVAGLTSLQTPSIGTLIQAQQTLLTTITPQDPAYVTFSFTDEEGQAFRDLNERRAKPITEKDLSIELQFSTGRLYPHRGRIDTSAPRVDPQTGTIQARAVFPNPDGLLLPGQFVRLRIHGITLLGAILVRKEAVSQGPQGPFVYVVGANDVAEVRPVRLGQEIGLDWVISDGLKAGDQVIVDGVIRVRPGAPVRPVKFVPEPEPQHTAPGGATP